MMADSARSSNDATGTPAHLPLRSRIGSVEYGFVSLLESVSDGDLMVLCRDADGASRYATLAEWRSGAQGKETPPLSCTVAAMGRSVSSASPTGDKLALFRLLFAGRDDVHAESYHDKKRDGIAYSPACSNFWKQGICPKRGAKGARCAVCENRAFTPLSDDALIRHMRGGSHPDRGVIGVYPLTDDCMTNFLVVDFDDEGWQRAVDAFRKTCTNANVPVAVERSRSGNGAHAWIFFSEPVDAGMARKMGAALLTHAMDTVGGVLFGSYDRMLPNQDIIPKGGYGNLVALPFQGHAMRDGNTVFVDEALVAYPDQWAYLSHQERMSKADVEKALADFGKNTLGTLAIPGEGASPASDGTHIETAPWRSRQKVLLGPSDVPHAVEVVKASGIYIPKTGMSPAALNALRRLAAMANPQFYKMQALRQSVFGTPRVLHFERETDEWLGLPRTCEAQVKLLLESCGAEVAVRDERCNGRAIKVAFRGELRDEQALIVEKTSEFEGGIIVAETGFGKTVVAAGLIARLKVNTLVIVPTVALLAQWKTRLAEFLDIDEEPPVFLTPTGRKSRRKASVIGQIGGGKREPSGIVDIALVGSLFEKGEVAGERVASGLCNGYGMVIVDECHHASAPNYTQVLSEICSRWVFGMTATPRRSDDLQGVMHLLLGPVRSRATPRDTAFSRLLVPRFTKTRPEETVEGDFVKTMECVCSDDARTAFIVGDVIDAWKSGRTSLVLTRRVQHAEALYRAISARECPTLLLTGGGTSKEKREKLEGIECFSPDAPFVIVGTESYLGEGFDERRLDTLFVAAPMAFEGLVAQCVGRIQRDCEGKTDVVVYDYVDDAIRMLDRMFRRRLKEYSRLGYTIGGATAESARGELIGCEAFVQRLDGDIAACTVSLLVASSELHLNRFASTLKLLARVQGAGCDVVVYLQKPRDESTRMAQRTERAMELGKREGIDVRLADGCPNLVVLDGRTVWYGGLAPLAFPREGEQALRMTDAAVARDLESSVLGGFGAVR